LEGMKKKKVFFHRISTRFQALNHLSFSNEEWQLLWSVKKIHWLTWNKFDSI
jgi:hypothetical protein